MVVISKKVHKLRVHRYLSIQHFYEKETHKNDEVEKDNKKEGERERVIEREREKEREKYNLE